MLDGSTLGALATALNDASDAASALARRLRDERQRAAELVAELIAKLSKLAAGAVDVTAFFGVVPDQLHPGSAGAGKQLRSTGALLPSMISPTAGGVRSITKAADATAPPDRPAWLVATTRAVYLPPCTTDDSTDDGTTALWLPLSIVALQSTVSSPSSTKLTVYSRTPLHGSLKPLHSMSNPSTPEANAAWPCESRTVTVPAVGASQQCFAPRDDTTRWRPAQLVARTLR